MDNKLKIKDLISIGIFGAVYIVVMMVTVTAFGTIPILYLTVPFFVGITCATVYMLFVMKVPKRGSVFILSVLIAILYLPASIPAVIYALLIGLVTEAVLAKDGYKSYKRIEMSFLAFANITVGPFLGILFAKDRFIDQCVEYYGQEYGSKLDALTPSWIILPLLGIAIIGGYIGIRIGRKILKKHFKKAGVI